MRLGWRCRMRSARPGNLQVRAGRGMSAPYAAGVFEPMDPEPWTEFFFTIAAAAAGLVGLIVVGLSIHVDFIAQSLTHRAHARATLVVLTATVVIAVAALIPQPTVWLGWEAGLVTLGFASINTYNNVKALRRVHWILPAAAWRRMAIGYATAVVGLIGAVSIALFEGAGGGLYWIALEVIASLVWAIAGAWRFLIGVSDEKRT
jgi:hypothetical protein